MILTDIISPVRYLINDNATGGSDIFTYTPTNRVFTLTENNPIAISGVEINASEIDDSMWSFDSIYNTVTVISSMSSGDTVRIIYTYYPNYSNTEIENYIRAAVIHLSVNNYYTFTVDTDKEVYPTPNDQEANLIAMIAAVLIEPDNKTYRLPDISISVPTGAISTDIKIRNMIAIMKKNTHGVFFMTTF
jgi:2C-methyl-D-erythritol 2,4-cyclodiphosphate synthase